MIPSNNLPKHTNSNQNQIDSIIYIEYKYFDIFLLNGWFILEEGNIRLLFTYYPIEYMIYIRILNLEPLGPNVTVSLPSRDYRAIIKSKYRKIIERSCNTCRREWKCYSDL